MNTKKYRWNLNKQFLTLTVLPIIGLGLIIMFVAYSLFNQTLIKQVEAELKNVASSVMVYFDLTYPGEYSLKQGTTDAGETTYDLLKGETVITREYSYIDAIRESTEIDITLFFMDTRILTTLYTSSNVRFIGTAAHPVIIEDVLTDGKESFYRRIIVNSTPYFAYYTPLRNSSGEIVGMLFAGKPSKGIEDTISHAMIPIILVSIFASFAVGAISVSNSRKIVFAIQRINTFLSRVAQGTLNMDLDSRILTRKDELGDMGRSAVNMQRSLHALVEQDVLTGLHNRRYGDRRLHQLHAQHPTVSSNFTIALGDIDFFKKVNDTYGHEAGDIVLKGVSELIKKYVNGDGYASRWGGEEFLFVFESISYKQSVERLESFLEELRNTTFMYKETPIRVTMTLGVAVCQPNDNLNILLKYADDKLYKGKTEGRNRIVT